MSLADEPDWKNAPAWANFLAMDRDGSWWWYELLPSTNGRDHWVRNRSGGDFCAASPADTCDTWMLTCEDRTCEEPPAR